MGASEITTTKEGRNRARKYKLGLLNIRVIQYKTTKADGTSALYLQLRDAKNQFRIPLQICVSPDDFDMARQRIRGTTPRIREWNLLIDSLVSKCTTIQLEYIGRGQHLTAAALRDELTNTGNRHSFVDFWRNEMSSLLKRGQIKLSTYRSESESLTRVLAFQADIVFADVHPRWLDDLEGFLRRSMHLSESTIHKTIKHLRKYVKRAIRSGVKLDDAFKAYSLPKASTTRIIWLTMDEIRRMHELYASSFIDESMKQTLRAFLFACFTGIRESDYHQVQADNIHGRLLQFVPIKTRRYQRAVRIPLTDRSMQYLHEDQSLGRLLSQQRMNDKLKQAASMVGIHKKVSTHVARHSFASNWVLAGRNLVALQQILGHSKLDMTMQYVHLHSRDLQAEMLAFEKWQ